jgi:O-antigen ligase
VPVLVVLLVAATYVLGRAASIDRFAGDIAVTEDQRFLFTPAVLAIIAATFPVGTGLGSFDKLFRQYEPEAMLTDRYANHAHNDLLELAMTTGAIGVLLLLAFLIWWAVRGWRAVREDAGEANLVGRLGFVAIALFFLASLTDYPLRTPFLAAVFALACAWLGGAGTRAAPPQAGRDTLP